MAPIIKGDVNADPRLLVNTHVPARCALLDGELARPLPCPWPQRTDEDLTLGGDGCHGG